MDSQTVERLILDRALGALSPDCATLLENYLATHAEAAALAREMDATASLARKALAEPVPAHVPQFTADPLALRSGPVRAGTRRWAVATWGKRVSGIAAAVLVGFGAHAFLYDAPGPEPAGLSSGRVLVSAGPRTTEDAGREGFWSARRLYERTSPSGAGTSEKVIWDSPVRAPRVGDQT